MEKGKRRSQCEPGRAKNISQRKVLVISVLLCHIMARSTASRNQLFLGIPKPQLFQNPVKLFLKCDRGGSAQGSRREQPCTQLCQKFGSRIKRIGTLLTKHHAPKVRQPTAFAKLILQFLNAVKRCFHVEFSELFVILWKGGLEMVIFEKGRYILTAAAAVRVVVHPFYSIS